MVDAIWAVVVWENLAMERFKILILEINVRVARRVSVCLYELMGKADKAWSWLETGHIVCTASG